MKDIIQLKKARLHGLEAALIAHGTLHSKGNVITRSQQKLLRTEH